MSISIYVAGSSDISERPRVRAVMNAVAALHGAHLSLDWLAAVEKAGSANAGLTHEQRATHAREDMAAILTSDVLLLLVPTAPSAGCWVEMGVALAIARSVTTLSIVCSGNTERSIFCALGVEMADDEVAVAYIRGLVACVLLGRPDTHGGGE